MTSASTPAPVVSDIRDLLRRISLAADDEFVDWQLDLAMPVLAEALAAMQAEHQRTVEALEAQLAEAKKALTIIEQKSLAALADVRCARSRQGDERCRMRS